MGTIRGSPAHGDQCFGIQVEAIDEMLEKPCQRERERERESNAKARREINFKNQTNMVVATFSTNTAISRTSTRVRKFNRPGIVLSI